MVIFQYRIGTGKITINYQYPEGVRPVSYDMTGWKVAYPLALGQEDVNPSTAIYNQLRAKIGQPGNYSITSIKLMPPDPYDWPNPELAYSDVRSANSDPWIYVMIASLFGKKINELGSNGLLLGGYVARKNGDVTGPYFPIILLLVCVATYHLGRAYDYICEKPTNRILL